MPRPAAIRRSSVPCPPTRSPRFAQQNNLPERFWLFVGTLEPRKNLTTLIDAYAALPEKPLLVIGGGKGWDYEPIFAAVERHGLGDSVRFAGFIPADDLPIWYNCAEAFVYPSVFEGFGMPVLEAMACGTPVIVSDASSLPEVAGDAGLCVPPNDVQAWTAALRRAWDDAAWRDQARARGLAQAARYTWAETARQTVESYRRAMA
ncbi:MAG: glycosyltransferase family 1 protein [Anaerolineae bacterium]